jgi:hypothetical protein
MVSWDNQTLSLCNLTSHNGDPVCHWSCRKLYQLYQQTSVKLYRSAEGPLVANIDTAVANHLVLLNDKLKDTAPSGAC